MNAQQRTVTLRRAFLRAVVPVTAAIIVLGGGALAAIETDIAPNFGDGIWWALSLMTTVGFTGPTPHTLAGRLLSGVIMLAGFAVLAMTTAAIASLFVREDEAPQDARAHDIDLQILRRLDAIEHRLTELERPPS